MSFHNSRSKCRADKSQPDEHGAITPVRAIAMILAQGVLRHLERQKALDNRPEQRVHNGVLTTRGETP